MESVLIVSGGKPAQTISSLISEAFPQWTQAAALNIREAKRLMEQRSFDMLVINSPLSDGDGLGLAEYASECSDAGIVLLLPPEDFERNSREAAAFGAAAIKKQPLGKASFGYALALVSGMRRRLLGIGSSADKTAEELKTLGRAKVALMHYLKFSEQQAHRYLEKQAMDLRIPIAEAALRVIKMYDLDAK